MASRMFGGTSENSKPYIVPCLRRTIACTYLFITADNLTISPTARSAVVAAVRTGTAESNERKWKMDGADKRYRYGSVVALRLI